jgi:hypothetical protein
LPQAPQNRAPVRRTAPQLGQAVSSAAPHWSQKRLSGGLSTRQAPHCMPYQYHDPGSGRYMGVVITALGYGVWNWCLERVAAFVDLQPLAGALLGVWWLREPLTPFLAAGGPLIVAGLHLTVKAGRRG